MRKIFAGLAALLWLAGCAAENPPPPPKRVVQSPESGLNDLDLVARAIPSVGNVLPVQIAVTNVTQRNLELDADSIQADTASGTSIGTLSADQAIEAAGGAQKLAEAVSRVYAVHVPGHQQEPGAGESAIRACVQSTALGAGAMFVCPIVIGGIVVQRMAVASSPSMQVADVAVSSETLPTGMERRGYIFLPVGNYKALELRVVDRSSGGVETIVEEWDCAADLADTALPKCDKTGMGLAARHGAEQYAAGEYTGALAYYQEALAACPASAHALVDVVRAYEALGESGMAADYYKRAIQFASTDDAAIAEQARQALARLSAH
jgi:hypothetical protein